MAVHVELNKMTAQKQTNCYVAASNAFDVSGNGLAITEASPADVHKSIDDILRVALVMVTNVNMAGRWRLSVHCKPVATAA